MMRPKEPLYGELALEQAGDDERLAAIAAPCSTARPVRRSLWRRRIVVTDTTALLCHPLEVVRGLLR
jgi:hypothetical protein